MANDKQLAVKKRLIYAEDLFEPVDATVLVVSVGGRSGGKTMAMYEQLFRERVKMAPTIDAVEVVRCKDCNYWKPSGSYGGDTVEDLQPLGGCKWTKCCRRASDYCSMGERRRADNAGA